MIGPVGSGKVCTVGTSIVSSPVHIACFCVWQSTLLQCLLHELPALGGTVTLNGTVGYVSQDPWIFSATLQQNILFGLPYDPDWYNTVVEACALDKVC